jgi:hypothetical protein
MEHSDNTNPLLKYYRQPGITCRLPSNGRFQDPDNVRFTSSGEISVLPMRAADEMLLKSPDALMSGMAIEKVIKSCVPDVKDPQQLPTPDVDTLLLAIRTATYGPEMNVDSNCPMCGTENSYTFDVNAVLGTVTPLDDEYPVRLNSEIIVYLRPFNFKNSTQASLVAFQEARKVQLIDTDQFTDEEKQRQLNQSFERINTMNVQMVADCVESVVVPEGTITNREHISQFVHNIEQKWVATIEERLKAINNAGINKNHTITCINQECKHEWDMTVEFDPANFFVQSS